MGQQRTDTSNQLAAKRRTAESRQCHHCKRLAALSSKYELRGAFDERLGHERKCRYCGARQGILNGEIYREGPGEHDWGPWGNDAAGVIRECRACGETEVRPEG